MKLVAILLCICFSGTAFANEAMRVRVAVGKVSEVQFPETVAKIIKGGTADSVLVEVLDRTIYVLPKTDAPASISVTGVSGTSYPLDLVISPQHDVRVQVPGAGISNQNKSPDTIALMKEVLLGQEPAGATIITNSQNIAFNDAITLTVVTIYDFPYAAIYILKASNVTHERVWIPLQEMSFPNMLAVTAKADMLSAKGEEGDSTKIYLLAGKQ